MEKIKDGAQCRFVTTDEFLQIAEEVSDKKLDWFWEVYFRQASLPKLNAVIKDNVLNLEWQTENNIPFYVSVEVKIDDEIGQLSQSLQRMIQSIKTVTANRDELNHEIEERLKAERKIKASLKEKETLLQEIHHRVKNNMQVIASLLDLQSSNTEDGFAKEALKESQNRIYAMSAVHETLYGSDNLSEIDLDSHPSPSPTAAVSPRSGLCRKTE